MCIENETPDHHAAVRRLHEAAFPSPAEADLVERLRADGDARLSLVALRGGRVIGHVMFSTMDAPFPALALAPVAVDARRQGVAAALVTAGIARAKADGCAGIVVLGDPAYYRRFGFSVTAAAGLDSPYAGLHLMLLTLDGGPSVRAGRIAHAPAFSALDRPDAG